MIKALLIKSPILSSQLIWPGENGLTGHEMHRAKFSQISCVVALPIGVRINRLLCVLKFCQPQISLIKPYFKKTKFFHGLNIKLNARNSLLPTQYRYQVCQALPHPSQERMSGTFQGTPSRSPATETS